MPKRGRYLRKYVEKIYVRMFFVAVCLCESVLPIIRQMYFSKDIAIHSLKTYPAVIFIFDIQVCIKSVYGIRLFILYSLCCCG